MSAAEASRDFLVCTASHFLAGRPTEAVDHSMGQVGKMHFINFPEAVHRPPRCGGTLPLFDRDRPRRTRPHDRPSGQCHPTNRFFCPCRIALVRSFPSFLTSQTRRRFRTYSALFAIVAKTSRRVSGKSNGDTETIYCGLFGLDEKEQQHHDIYSILLSRPLSLSLLFSRAFPRPRRRVGLLEPTAIC